MLTVIPVTDTGVRPVCQPLVLRMLHALTVGGGSAVSLVLSDVKAETRGLKEMSQAYTASKWLSRNLSSSSLAPESVFC